MKRCPYCQSALWNHERSCKQCGEITIPPATALVVESGSLQAVDMPAARWEENARALLKMALELAYEVKSRCNDPIHDEQIASLRALETEWAGSGHIAKLRDAGERGVKQH